MHMIMYTFYAKIEGDIPHRYQLSMMPHRSRLFIFSRHFFSVVRRLEYLVGRHLAQL